jgi:hypothetical protein
MGSVPLATLDPSAAGGADRHERPPAAGSSAPPVALAAAVLGFFVVTLDAVVVNVALPSIRREFAPASPACSGWWTATC